MTPPLFQFELQVLALTDQVPGPPERARLVTTSPSITIAGAPTSPTHDPSTVGFQTRTNTPAPVPVVVAIVRHTRTLTIRGSVQRQGGHWYWIGGGHRIPLGDDDPCVTRVWPDGRSMSDQDYARFCRTRTITASVNPGTAWTINLSYDLAAEQVTGDATGPAGAILHLHRDLGANGQIDLRLVVKAVDDRSFARDIRPLFRDIDIESMKSPQRSDPFDLSSYDDVKARAQSILGALSYTLPDSRMPCDGKWPPGPLLVFRQWLDRGMPP
jgi:hypothetical protein